MRPDASKKLAAAAPKQGPNVAVIGGVIAAIIIVGVVVLIMVLGKSASSSGFGASGSSAPPLSVTGSKDGGIVVNAATAKSNAPTLDLWEDFQCPGCAQLEKSVGAQMAQMAKAGEIKLVVHMLSFLDGKLGNDSSLKAANAAACASDAGKFLEYHAAVFAAQPAREGDGYTDAQLTEFATTSGITGAALTTWQTCTTSGRYAKYAASVQQVMDKALQEEGDKAKVKGTPTVLLNGTTDVTSSVQTPEALVAVVKAATK